MIYEIEVMMDDRGRFVRRLCELEAEGLVEVQDSGQSATTVQAELEIALGANRADARVLVYAAPLCMCH